MLLLLWQSPRLPLPCINCFRINLFQLIRGGYLVRPASLYLPPPPKKNRAHTPTHPHNARTAQCPYLATPAIRRAEVSGDTYAISGIGQTYLLADFFALKYRVDKLCA